MTTTIGYNSQCTNVGINYQHQNYLNVDLSIVKNEPIDSIDYQQTNQQIYHYVQHHQQISPQLPPTPPSPNSSNDTTQIEQIHKQQILNQNNQINQSLTNQSVTNPMCPTKLNNQINSNKIQLNDQMNNQMKNQQIKGQNVYSITKSNLQIESNQQAMTTKYRKNKTNLHNFKPYSLPTETMPLKTKPNSISRRNERERKRVKNVNEGFKKLRDHIPNNEKKMSKVETLRSAVKYIKELEELLHGPGTNSTSNTDFLFNFIHQNASSSLQQAIKNESSNSSNQHNQTSVSLDYFDLAELLSE